MATHTVTIEHFPANRVEAARELISKAHAKLVRAAAKAGQDAPAAPQLVVTREFIVSVCPECKCTREGFTSGATCGTCPASWMRAHKGVDLQIVAERPALAGWEFLAVIEPLTGGNLLRALPGAEIATGELDQYRTGNLKCDHCKAARRRTETFIVRADGSDAAVPAGTHRQVGRQCISVFLGGKSAAAIVASLAWEQLVRSAGDGEGGGGGHESMCFEPADLLAWVAASVRLDGWTSRGAARDDTSGASTATADRVRNLLTPPFSIMARDAWHAARTRCNPSDEDRTRGAAALAWARSLAGTSDYEQNLKLIADQEAIESKHIGILASAIPAYGRVLGEAARRAGTGPSAHVGAVGERITLDVTIERVTTIETQYGALFINSFRDTAGNVLVWKTGKGQGMAGDKITITGTVKAHSEYRGEAQTELARCKVARVAQDAHAAA